MTIPKRLERTYLKFKSETKFFCENQVAWIEKQNENLTIIGKDYCNKTVKRGDAIGDIEVTIQDNDSDNLFYIFETVKQINKETKLGKLENNLELIVMTAFFYEADYWLKEIGEFRIYQGNYKEEFFAALEEQVHNIYEVLVDMAIKVRKEPYNSKKSWNLGDRFTFYF